MTTFTQIGAVGTTDNLEVAPHWLGVYIYIYGKRFYHAGVV